MAPDEQAPELLDRLFKLGTQLLLQRLPDVFAGRGQLLATPQVGLAARRTGSPHVWQLHWKKKLTCCTLWTCSPVLVSCVHAYGPHSLGLTLPAARTDGCRTSPRCSTRRR